MARLKFAVSALIILILGAMVYHAVTNVSVSDISAYHKFEFELGGIPVRAGDIVAVSRDGAASQPICTFQLDAERVDTVDVDAIYVNDLGRQLPDFMGVFAVLLGSPVSAASGRSAGDSIRFSGTLTTMKVSEPDDLGHACECAMARRLLRGERVCTTYSALSRRDTRFVQAIRFATYSNFVSRETFAACGLPYSETVEALASERCAGQTNLPWDSRVRRGLNLIEAHPPAMAGMSAAAMR